MNYTTIPADEVITKASEALARANITAHTVMNKEEALEKVRSLIPEGASVMTGSSVTLEQIGFVDLLKSGNHTWNNLKNAIVAEKDPVKQTRLRKEATAADFFLGSVHAVTEEGEAIIASNTGSQIPAYAFNAPNLIWVVGAQKIVPDLSSGMKRLREYIVPLENKHMQELYGIPTNLSKILIFRKETGKRNIHIVFVKETLGF